MQPNFSSCQSPYISAITEGQIEEIIQAALLILERTGVKVTYPPALKLLSDAGAYVHGERTRLPRLLVLNALALAPKGLVLYDRNGRLAMNLSNGKSYFGTSTASPNNIDARTGQRHPTTLKDIADGALIADALPHLDFVMPFGTAQDVPAKAGEVHEFVTLMSITPKPVVFCGYSAKGVEKVLEMAALVAGGKDELKRKPFVVPYPEPITPLHFPDEVVSRMFVCCDFGIPQINAGAQLMTLTAPGTLAGSLALATAESFFAITLNQLRKPGSPCFLTTSVGAVNHKTGSDCLASPEFCLTIAAQSQIAQRLGLPTWGLAGATDSKALDAQAGAESAMSILIHALSGISLIHDVGYVDSGMASSAAMMVLGDEIISWTKRIMAGMEVSAETLALEVIDNVGPGGNFLSHKHTASHFRRESWFPSLFRKDQYDTWKSEGSPTCEQAMYQKTGQLLENHKPRPVSESLLEELKKMATEAEKELLS
ncbi:MAG: trimethylamine methyltransferase family protein [Deltaproteobacteria bacterium]|nr:trimethylamine methyltransferase family protein [Deltaproteobacteria bacterium]